MFKRKYKAMMMAWLMLLSFLPQVLVKSFHQHNDSLDKVECNFAVRAAQQGTPRSDTRSDSGASHKQQEKQRKQLAQHQKKSTDDGQSDKGNDHDCAICHYLISPFTPPTFAAFSFYAPTVLVAYLQQADAVHTIAVSTPQLRGPPQA